jgi:hypothetical protein
VNRAPWPVLAVVLLVLTTLTLRTVIALRPGLWADEIFSLAMATGHSLEHPAADADVSRGDFVEPREAEPARAFRRYTEHEPTAPGVRRILRAVLLSDTSPPLYYLLLSQWTRWLGTSDAALRLFSVLWSVLSLPLLWLVGRELGGERAAGAACLLFLFSPIAMYYSAEGRMYALLWFLGLALAWLTLRLSQHVRPSHAALWVIASATGLLTHYFFAFVWLACVAWMGLRRPRAVPWRMAAVLAVTTLLLIVPWYLEVPASAARWRVSGRWLQGELAWPGAIGRPLVLAGDLLSGRTDLGGWRRADQLTSALLLLLAVGVWCIGALRRLFAPPALLCWAWLVAACTGPLVFDVLHHTKTTDIPRYALPGLPAALLLTALVMSLVPLRAQILFLGVLLLGWLPGDVALVGAPTPRPRQPYRQLDARLESWARSGDVVLVRSIPSGIVGVARYLRADIPVASWVAQLGSREVPGDLQQLLRGRARVAVVTVHDLGAPNPVDPWLKANARLLGRETFRSSSAEIMYYAPAEGTTFFPVPAAASR